MNVAAEGGPEARGDGPIDVALIGVGTYGLRVGLNLLAHPERFRVVAAVEEYDKGVQGRDLGEVAGGEPIGVPVTAELPAEVELAAAIQVTYSQFERVEPMIRQLVERGVNVVTSAEELGHPWHEFPQRSRELDEFAKRHGVTVVGAGANPGFVLDALPVVASIACRGVHSIRANRTLDVSHQREHRLRHFGIGEDSFEPGQGVGGGGHVGYRQSIDAIADALGWQLDDIVEDPVAPAIVASSPREGRQWTVPAGKVAVVRQGARGFRGEVPVIELSGYFGFVREEDPIPKNDLLAIEGSDQSFELRSSGLAGPATTPAVLLNLVAPTVRAEPGLRGSLDFRLRDFCSVGL